MSSEITLRLSATQARRLRTIARRLNVTPAQYATVVLFASIDSHALDPAGFIEWWPNALGSHCRGGARRKSRSASLEKGFTKLATVPTNPKATCAARAAHGSRRVSPNFSDPVGSLVGEPPVYSAIIFQPSFSVPGVPAQESAPAVQLERPHNLGSVLYWSACCQRDARRGGLALCRNVVITGVEVDREAQWEAVKTYRQRFDSIDEAISCFRAVETKCVKRWDVESVLTAVRKEAQFLAPGDALVVFSPFDEAGELLGAVTRELEQMVGFPIATIARRDVPWGAEGGPR